MKKYTLIVFAFLAGVSVVVTAVHYLMKPYIEEEARIGQLADQLKWRKGDATEWSYRYHFELPSNPKISDLSHEEAKVPQIIFAMTNDEDESKASYWALNINGTNPQLLIPEGVIPAPKKTRSVDYSKYLSRSPNGRYLVIPLKGQTILYDIRNKEITKLGETLHYGDYVMWKYDSSQVTVKIGSKLQLVKLPSKEVVDFFQVNDIPDKNSLSFSLRDSRAFWDRKSNKLYLVLYNGGYVNRWYRGYFSDSYSLPPKGNSLVIDASNLKVVDLGDYVPLSCDVSGSKLADGFYCKGYHKDYGLGHYRGYLYLTGKPAKLIADYESNASLLALNAGDIWFTKLYHRGGKRTRQISRVLTRPASDSPTTKISYFYRAHRNGKPIDISAYGFGFSRYVIEHADNEKWGDSLYFPDDSDLEKAMDLLKERGDI